MPAPKDPSKARRLSADARLWMHLYDAAGLLDSCEKITPAQRDTLRAQLRAALTALDEE